MTTEERYTPNLSSEDQQRCYIKRKIEAWLVDHPDDTEIPVSQMLDGDVLPVDVEAADYRWTFWGWENHNRGTAIYKRD